MILIQAIEAYEPIPGMIATKLNTPPLIRYEVATLPEALAAVKKEHKRLKSEGINHQVSAFCYGKKPRSWNKTCRTDLIKDYIE